MSDSSITTKPLVRPVTMREHFDLLLYIFLCILVIPYLRLYLQLLILNTVDLLLYQMSHALVIILKHPYSFWAMRNQSHCVSSLDHFIPLTNEVILLLHHVSNVEG